MAVLSAAAGRWPEEWERVVRFGGAERVLGAQGAALPQPEQLCGPFAARAALHAVLPAGRVPDLLRIAHHAGTRIWPHDVPAARPAGAPAVRLGWDELPGAAAPEEGGTHAAGLAAGVVAATGGAVAVVPVRRGEGRAWPALSLRALLGDVAAAPYPVGVVANVRTGPLVDDAAWDVGHFVVLWAVDPTSATVAIADSYAEVTGYGAPPGCRLVPDDALGVALGADAGRGLLLLTEPRHAAVLAERAVGRGMSLETWRT